MKYKITIQFEVDSDDYLDVSSLSDVQDLVEAMFDSEADFPEDRKATCEEGTFPFIIK